MNRVIIFSIAMLSAISAMADKRMTIRYADTGESFEITVPDGFKMYSYNGNWLVSIPYLVEHARYGEPWAYEALADCHRYGKGGLKRSLINALFYYKLAGKNIENYIAEIGQNDHDDQWLFSFELSTIWKTKTIAVFFVPLILSMKPNTILPIF